MQSNNGNSRFNTSLSIGIFLNYWLGWGGGRDFIANFMSSLHDTHFKITPILLANVTTPIEITKIQFNTLPTNVRELLGKEISGILLMPTAESINFFLDKFDYLGFTCSPPLSEKCSEKWIGYIPDMLHSRHPTHLGIEECTRRDISFRSIVNKSLVTICFTSSTERILRSRYLDSASTTSVRRMCPPLIDFQDTFDYSGAKTNDRYFIVCSQNWMHKDFLTILRAFFNFSSEYGQSNIKLIFTGSLDGNWPEDQKGKISSFIESNSISQSVKFLGHIDKDLQLSLIANAVALISASINEGGPAAGGILEATSLGTPVIASATEEHLEWNYSNTHFFTPKCFKSLCNAMQFICKQETSPARKQALTHEIITSSKKIFSFQLANILLSSTNSRNARKTLIGEGH
jgi:glycosyltransferase involved in cell wall biosynthesis